MPDTTQAPLPLKRTVFPFPKRANGNDQTTADASARDYFQALSQAEDGFFPIGYNGQWHGGIHFGAETGASLDQDDGIRCIADGQVIAYRIDGDYPTVDYESCAAAKYSRGFVLVRHRLQLPPAPQAVCEDTGAANSTQEGEPSLVFFSLYMHLRNWNSYTADPDLKRPAFWDGSVYLVGERAVDSDRARNRFIPESGGAGMNIRDGQHRISGFAPRGVKLKLGDANPARGGFFRIMEVVGGTTYPADLAGMYVFKGTDSSAEGLDPVSQPHSTDTVYIPPEPVDIKAGDLVGHLGEYQRYLDMDALAQCASGRPLAQVDVFTHEDLQAFIAQSRARDVDLDARQKTLLHIKPGARLVQPAEPDIELPADQAVVLVPGQGDGRWARGRRGTVAIVDQRPAGFTSATRTYGDGRIFLAAVDAQGNEMTLDEFNALADKATYPRRKLLTPEGDDIWVDAGRANAQGLVTAPSRAWSSFPLQVSNPQEEAVGYSRVVPVAAIEETVEEGDGTRWFRIDAATTSGQSTRGWVRESGQDNVELCSPWAWPGFELFDVAELEPRDLFARHLCLGGGVQPQERGALESAACNVEQSELFEALRRAVDANGDQEVTPIELRNALRTDWLAQAISRLVIRYSSEWSNPSNRWAGIDDLIDDRLLRRDWEHEKERIHNLVIWSEVGGRHEFPSDPIVHHLHPVGFIENFFAASKIFITVEMLRIIFTTAAEGRLKSIADEVNSNISDYKLDTPLRLSHFFAQVREEIGAGARFEESLNYNPAGLINTFHYFASNPDEAHAFGRSGGQAADQEAIANRAYSRPELGNGDIASGDGWRYRGRGLKMTTGRTNYQDLQDNYHLVWPGTPPDFVADPDLLATPRYAVQAAVFFWIRHSLYEIADRGATDANVDAITRVINLHTASYAARRGHFSNIWKAGVFAAVGE